MLRMMRKDWLVVAVVTLAAWSALLTFYVVLGSPIGQPLPSSFGSTQVKTVAREYTAFFEDFVYRALLFCTY